MEETSRARHSEGYFCILSLYSSTRVLSRVYKKKEELICKNRAGELIFFLVKYAARSLDTFYFFLRFQPRFFAPFLCLARFVHSLVSSWLSRQFLWANQDRKIPMNMDGRPDRGSRSDRASANSHVRVVLSHTLVIVTPGVLGLSANASLFILV